MHSPVYLAICAASVSGMLLLGTPERSGMVFGLAFAIAVLGVPHGGLDHWTGRRLLQHRLGNHWWAVFFPTYLLVGLTFAIGWFVMPTITVLAFFLISAWHFGREEQLASDCPSPLQTKASSSTNWLLSHCIATAMGGLVIWIASIARPEEMAVLLSLIIPADGAEPSIQIVAYTQWLAAFLVPMATAMGLKQLIRSPRDWESWVPVATAVVAICLPILVSFAIYFCAWHSWQGLQRLRRSESLSVAQFIRYTAPLSVAAIIGVIAAAWWMQGTLPTRALGDQTSASLQTVFIGLSAIAVPHLFLHEFDASRTRLASRHEVYA